VPASDCRPAAGSVLAFEDVSFRYERDAPIIKNFSFTLRPGGRVGIVGSSGCGKSTLLGLVTGRLRPTAGRMVRGWNTACKNTPAYGLIGQGNGLFPWRTVEENILSGYRARTRPTTQDLEKQLARIGLSPALLSAFPATLSVGMSKRVEILRALGPMTGLLIADEPLAPLDIHAAKLTTDLIEQNLDSRSGALFMVTHDLQIVAAKMEEVLVFSRSEPGEISLLSNPARGLPLEDPISESFRLKLAQAIGAL
jgi:NitT/TauT family transport system ATP-binding protein